MSYQVPHHIDNNQIFIVNRSEIEGRLDPMFYTSQFVSIIKLLKKSNLCKQLGRIAHFSSEMWNQKDYYTKDFPYIEIGAINIIDGKINEVSRVPIEKAPSRARVIVRTNDIIISTTRPSRGAISKISEQENLYIASTGFSVIRGVDNSVNRDYLFSVLRLDISLKQMMQRSTGGNYPAITQEELSKILIPLPLVDIQNRIVSIIQTAYSKKQSKESKAQQFLDNIDTYLLNELGITLPNSKNDLTDRVFFISYKNLTGKRVDPKKYSLQVQQLYDCIKASCFETKTLKTFVGDSCSGDWGIEECDTIPEGYTRCLTLRATEIDNQYNLDIDTSKVKYRLIKDERLEKMNVSENDIIIEKSGGSDDQPVGRVAIIDKELLTSDTIAFCNFLMKIKVSGINPDYLYCFLKTMYNIGVTDSMQSQTNGIRNLILDEFLSQTIVVPPPEKQIEIANHIYELRQQAKTLQEEGKRILELAKQEVERMILQ